MTTATTARRVELAEAATDHVLEHGLIGLSLRPLAAALGTSDRMLLYHFADKDDLVATVLRISNDRSIAEIRRLPPSRDVRRPCWTCGRAHDGRPARACQRLYVEAAALGLLGREPYVTVVREANERWVAAVADHLVAAGADRRRVPSRGHPARRDVHGAPARPAAGPPTSPGDRRAVPRPRGRASPRWRVRAGRSVVGRRGDEQAVGDQRREAPLALRRSRPGRLEPAAVDRAVGVAQHREQPAAALPVGAGLGLAASRAGPSYAG